MSSEILPEPPKPGLISYLKAVGPGVILGSLAIGSGEWILFPAVVVKFGPYLLWAALLSCVIQAVVAVESMNWLPPQRVIASGMTRIAGAASPPARSVS